MLRFDALALSGTMVLLIRPRRKASLVLMKMSLSIRACISSRSHSHRSTYASTILSCHICISSPRFFKSFAFSWSPNPQPGTHGLCSRKAAFSYALRLSFGAASMMIVAMDAALPSTVQDIFLPLCRSRSYIAQPSTTEPPLQKMRISIVSSSFGMLAAKASMS